MPPRHAYWTILVDEQPTAFRAALLEDLQPTFKRLQKKHPSARVVWFQNGKVWNSRLDAQEAMRARGEMGRRGDVRQQGGFRNRTREARPPQSDGRNASGKLEWKPKGDPRPRAKTEARPKLEWTPKGTRGTGPSPARGTRHEAPNRRDSPQRDRRDRNWRPGGEHRDPRQKYKDAKKAKWTRFKQTIRKRWEAKQPRKKKDEE
jgi:hypothetical protein